MNVDKLSSDELLCLAAKSINGIYHEGGKIEFEGFLPIKWNPLEDIMHAISLADELKMEIKLLNYPMKMVIATLDNVDTVEFAQCRGSAMRTAIVKAAAKYFLGKKN